MRQVCQLPSGQNEQPSVLNSRDGTFRTEPRRCRHIAWASTSSCFSLSECIVRLLHALRRTLTRIREKVRAKAPADRPHWLDGMCTLRKAPVRSCCRSCEAVYAKQRCILLRENCLFACFCFGSAFFTLTSLVAFEFFQAVFALRASSSVLPIASPPH